MHDQQPVRAGHVHAQAEGQADRRQVAEQHEGDHDRQQREERAHLLAHQVAPDQVRACFMPPAPCRARPCRGAACAWPARRRADRGSPSRSSCRARAFSARSRSRISSPDLRSRSPVGSSQSSSVGSVTIARAMPDPLLLAAGELPWVVPGAVGQADQRERGGDVLLALGSGEVGQQQRQLDVALGGEHGQQVVELEDEADVARAPAAEPASGEAVDPLAADLDRALRVGVSRPPIRLSSVVLPEPDGPIRARNSPGGISQVDAAAARRSSPSRAEDLVQVADLRPAVVALVHLVSHARTSRT